MRNAAGLVETGVEVAERYLIIAVTSCVRPDDNGGSPEIHKQIIVRVESYARDKFSLRKWRRSMVRGMKKLGITRKWRKNLFKLDSIVVRPEIQLKQEATKWPKIFVIELGPKIEIVSK